MGPIEQYEIVLVNLDPTRVPVHHNNSIGWIAIDQIRTIDKARIIRKLGNLTDNEIKKTKDILHKTLVL